MLLFDLVGSRKTLDLDIGPLNLNLQSEKTTPLILFSSMVKFYTILI